MNRLSRHAAALLLSLAPNAVVAAPPHTSAATAEPATARDAGVFKTKVGTFTVVAISDGDFALATDQLLVDRKPGEVSALLAGATQPTIQPTSVNAYLIDTGAKHILVDTGSGTYFGPTLGNVRKRLSAAGYTPDTIDEVLITHLHPDHVGGLTVDGRMAFPNAIVRLAGSEEHFWLDKANARRVDASVQSSFDAAVASLAPYIAARRVKTFRPGASIAPGVSAAALPGHTIGHTGYRVHSGTETMLIWGDVVHVALVQLKDPDITIKFDSVPGEARTSRNCVFAEAAQQGYLIAGAHLAFPGIGRLERGREQWRWIPSTKLVAIP